MTYAPATIRELGAYWTQHGGVNLGIVGDTSHVNGGVSYHLGRSDLREDAYSIVLQRDKAGLSEAASAIDLGKLDGSLFNLQIFSQWLVRQCQAHAPGTRDIREVIYTPNGLAPIHRWSEPDQRIYTGAGQGDLSHLTHTHISFYRDSENRDKVGIFAPYFESTPPESSTEEPDMRFVYETSVTGYVASIKRDVPVFDVPAVSEPNRRRNTSIIETWLTVGWYRDPAGARWLSRIGADGTVEWVREGDLATQPDVALPAPPAGDCSAVQAELDAANAKIAAAQEALA